MERLISYVIILAFIVLVMDIYCLILSNKIIHEAERKENLSKDMGFN